MTRKEKMAFKHLTKQYIYEAVQSILMEHNRAKDFIKFHEYKDKAIDRAAKRIADQVAAEIGVE